MWGSQWWQQKSIKNCDVHSIKTLKIHSIRANSGTISHLSTEIVPIQMRQIKSVTIYFSLRKSNGNKCKGTSSWNISAISKESTVISSTSLLFCVVEHVPVYRIPLHCSQHTPKNLFKIIRYCKFEIYSTLLSGWTFLMRAVADCAILSCKMLVSEGKTEWFWICR